MSDRKDKKRKTPTPAARRSTGAEKDVDALTEGLGDVSLGADAKSDSSWRVESTTNTTSDPCSSTSTNG